MRKSLKRILTPWIPDTVKLAYDDPPDFKNSGVTGEQFEKILDALVSSNDVDLLARVIGAFSGACSANEWYDLYKPILTRQRPAGLTIGWFNGVFPDDKIIPFKKRKEITEGRIIPHVPKSSHGYIILWENGIETVNGDFTARRTYHRKDWESIEHSDTVFIEAFFKGKSVFISDYYCYGSDLPLFDRVFDIERVWSDYLSGNENITMVDFLPDDLDVNSIREHFSMVCGMEISKGLVKSIKDFQIDFREISL